MVNTA